MEGTVYLVRFSSCRLIFVLFLVIRFNLLFLVLGKGDSFTKGICPMFEQRVGGQRVFLVPVLLNCLQLTIIRLSKGHIWWHIMSPINDISYNSCTYHFNHQLEYGPTDLLSISSFPNLRSLIITRFIQYAVQLQWIVTSDLWESFGGPFLKY